jgi:hypothetical protein
LNNQQITELGLLHLIILCVFQDDVWEDDDDEDGDDIDESEQTLASVLSQFAPASDYAGN